MAANGWKPRCALRVGVVGNRKLQGMESAVAQASGEVWKTLIDSIVKVLDLDVLKLFDDQPPRLAVLSSLAAGADQIGAKTALDVAAAQERVVVELEALLPFREEDYPGLPGATRPEFTEDDARELGTLAAHATQVVRLDGDYATDRGRVDAYRQARDLLVQNSDILISIYDPAAAGGDAGTLETIKVALDLNTPIIAIEFTAGGAHISTTPQSNSDWRKSVDDRVREQLVLPELLQQRQDGESLQHALRRLQLVADPDAAHWLCKNGTFAKIFSWTWLALRWATWLIASREAKKELQKALRMPDAKDDITLDPYAHLYLPASKLAEAFMRTYRGAFVLSYTLAGLAVAVAVVMILKGSEHGIALTATLCVLKVGILVALLLLERASRKLRLHEAAVDFRYLAELLRPMQWLSPAGVYPPAVDLPLHSASADLRRSWMAWLVRAAARSSPSMSANMEHQPAQIAMTRDVVASVLDRARKEWIYGQIVYHARNTARMEALGEGLERWAKVLLWTVLIAAIAACALELFAAMPIVACVLESFAAMPVAAVLGAAAAILPAFIAALIGVAFQSEAKRLAQRSEAMHEALVEQRDKLESIATTLRAGGASHAEVITILKKLSSITIAEAADWKLLYQVHEVRAS
jgi:hypothetical protein